MRATQLDIFSGGASTARSFETDAMGFLLAYAKRSQGRPFSAECVTMAASEAGLAPVDLRAWWTVFAQAARGVMPISLEQCELARSVVRSWRAH
jgi:hypothetical protein